ncbi:hypothetical protein BgiBS90_017368, partial [Biomphalaria glabrata]
HLGCFANHSGTMTQRFADICDSLILCASNQPRPISHHSPPSSSQASRQQHSPSRKPLPPPPPQRRQSQPPTGGLHVDAGHLSTRPLGSVEHRGGHHDVRGFWR